MSHYLYILKCADDSYYVGSTSNLERRLEEHRTGSFKGYTRSRRPVKLVWSSELPTQNDAFLLERKIKGWTHAKKEALIRGDWDGIHQIVTRERKAQDRKKKHEANRTPLVGEQGAT